MRTLLAVAAETFLRLRRDKVFLPALLIGASLLGLTGLASFWGVEEFFKIMYDLGTASYLFTGSAVAIFWGNKIVSDSRQEGSLEVQLASPIGRSVWLLGKFLGLAFALVLLGFGFLIAWQGIYLGYGMGWMRSVDFVMFALLTMVWFVMAALSIFFAALATQAVALFCTIWMFVCGMISGPILQALSPETPAATKQLIGIIAGIWNLHLFNIAQSLQRNPIPEIPADIGVRFGYGGLLLGLFLAAACLAFQKRDIIAS